MGYSLVSETAGAPEGGSRSAWVGQHRRELSTAASGLLILLALAFRLVHLPEPAVTAANIAAIAAGGFTVARAGWASLRSARSLDMNALMSIAAIGSIFVGESAEGAVAIFLFSLGNLLESYTMDRARSAIRGLMGCPSPRHLAPRRPGGRGAGGSASRGRPHPGAAGRAHPDGWPGGGGRVGGQPGASHRREPAR